MELVAVPVEAASFAAAELAAARKDLVWAQYLGVEVDQVDMAPSVDLV